MCLLGVIEITDFTPLIMVIPSIEEEVEEEVGNRGRREWLQERPMERSNGDSNRGNGQDNGMRPQLTTSTNVPQTNRQDDEWSAPPIPERGDIMGR